MTRRTFRPSPALLVALIALLVSLGGSALAATGDTFILGKQNSADQTTLLGSSVTSGPTLRVANSAGLPAARFDTSAAAPFSVNNTTKVQSLNADLLDGLDSAALQKRITGTCASGQAIRVVNADGTVSCQALSGAGAFWSLTGNAGTTASNFLGTTDAHSLVLKVNGEQALRLDPTSTADIPSDTPNLIGGSPGNVVSNVGRGVTPIGATIAGGGFVEFNGVVTVNHPNRVTDDFGTVGGGEANQAGNGAGSFVDGANATVAGGFSNTASAHGSTVSGGSQNTASSLSSTIAGGSSNTAGGDQASTVAGGYFNHATNLASVIAGGGSNTASGEYSAVVGGFLNTAGGDNSFAAGRHAMAMQDGSFVWGDDNSAGITSPAANTFTVRAAGGIWLGKNSSPSIPAGRFLNTSTGGYLSSGGVWTSASDRAGKHDLRPLDSETVLDKVAHLPITSWSYKAEQPSVRHIGPMAQDFYSAFELGLDNRHISTIDSEGVALAAIQGLYRQNQGLRRQNRSLNARLARLERMVGTLTR